MSGPKSYSYRVDPAVIAAQQEAARLREVSRQLTIAAEALAARHAAAAERWGSGVSRISALPVIVDAEASHIAVRAAIREAEATLDHEIEEASFQRFASTITAGVVVEERRDEAERAALERALGRARTEVPTAGRSADDIVETVARIVARLAPTATETERAHIDTLAVSALEGGAAVEGRIDVLRSAVAEVTAAVRERAARGAAVDAALEALASVDVDGVSTARRDLRLARDGAGPLPAPLLRRVEALVAEGREETARAYLAASLATALTDLGYGVEASFATHLESTGYADVRTPWDGYVIRVRRPAGAQTVRVNVVRGPGAVATAQDIAVEATVCESYEQLTDDLAGLGVAFDRTSALDPGAVPVQVDQALPEVKTAPVVRHRRAERRAPRERER
ncbi:MAG: hypothetical protein AAGC46_00805 [Solirubrobacteraceae bacterium]|nr:hypothetical protein [Patulibacter sp.]